MWITFNPTQFLRVCAESPVGTLNDHARFLRHGRSDVNDRRWMNCVIYAKHPAHSEAG
jgi:hypothetical protein